MKCQEPDNPILAVVLLLSVMGIALGVVILIADGEWTKVLSVLTVLGCVMLFFRYNR
jgi:hypothetical protein